MAVSIFVYVFGQFFMFASDAQKYFTLKYKQGLIDEGLFARNRNTNYLGEVLIYASFAILAEDIVSWGILILVWSSVFLLNILMKDLSLRRKKGFENYEGKSYLFLFRFFSSHFANLSLYVLFFGVVFYFLILD